MLFEEECVGWEAKRWLKNYVKACLCQTSVVPRVRQCHRSGARIHNWELPGCFYILQENLRVCKETGNFNHCCFSHWNPLERNAIERAPHLPFKVTCKWGKMGLWPCFWLSYEGLGSWQGFEATLGFNFLFLHFSIFFFLLLECSSCFAWHLLAIERTHEIQPWQGTDNGMPERRTHSHTSSWFASKRGEGTLLAALGRRESICLASVGLYLTPWSKEILGESKALIKI